MSNDNSLLELFAIEAEVKVLQLPKTFRTTWAEIHRYSEDSLQDHTIKMYVSLSGRLQNKCIFIEGEEAAHWLRDYMQQKLEKKYADVHVTAKRVSSKDLDYRRKNAMGEALENTTKIETMMAESA